MTIPDETQKRHALSEVRQTDCSQVSDSRLQTERQEEMNTYQDKNRERYAHLTVEIRFVGHGFQADFYDRTLATADGQGIIHCTECRDYADSLPITERANSAVRQIIKALRAESPLL